MSAMMEGIPFYNDKDKSPWHLTQFCLLRKEFPKDKLYKEKPKVTRVNLVNSRDPHFH